MVKPPYIDEYGMKKGAWSQDEDNKLRASIEESGHRIWRLVPVAAGLKRCGKSCRLRWMNYLKPGLKRGNFTKQEDELITELHSQLGNKWSAIASNFPDRTDNDIKNYYHAHIKKRKFGATTRAIRPELPRQEEQTSDSNSCITNDLDQEKPTASSEFVFHEENIGDVVSNADRAPYGMGTDLGQLSIPYDYADGEIAYWNYSTAIFSQVDLGGEECFGMGFW